MSPGEYFILCVSAGLVLAFLALGIGAWDRYTTRAFYKKHGLGKPPPPWGDGK